MNALASWPAGWHSDWHGKYRNAAGHRRPNGTVRFDRVGVFLTPTGSDTDALITRHAQAVRAAWLASGEDPAVLMAALGRWYATLPAADVAPVVAVAPVVVVDDYDDDEPWYVPGRYIPATTADFRCCDTRGARNA